MHPWSTRTRARTHTYTMHKHGQRIRPRCALPNVLAIAATGSTIAKAHYSTHTHRTCIYNTAPLIHRLQNFAFQKLSLYLLLFLVFLARSARRAVYFVETVTFILHVNTRTFDIEAKQQHNKKKHCSLFRQ